VTERLTSTKPSGGLTKSTVMVTGATGFLGCRLVEYLALGLNANVVALARSFGSPGMLRLARLPVKVVRADLLNQAEVISAAKDCDYIVHCAYGNRGEEKTRRRITVDGTANVLEAGRQSSSVSRIVTISTSTVHATPDGQTITEDAPFFRSGRVYTDSKIEAEKVALDYHRRFGLPVAVLRPTRIFGPWSEPYGTRVVSEIMNRSITLINGGGAKANLVYVDNVIAAILLCLTRAESSGQAFLVNGDEKVTWKEFYEGFQSVLLGAPPLRSGTIQEIKQIRANDRRRMVTSSASNSWNIVKSGFPRLYHEVPIIQGSAKKVYAKLPQGAKKRAKGFVGKPGAASSSSPSTSVADSAQDGENDITKVPELWRAENMAEDAWFSSDKIKKILGYTQPVSFEEAMQSTKEWLGWLGLTVNSADASVTSPAQVSATPRS